MRFLQFITARRTHEVRITTELDLQPLKQALSTANKAIATSLGKVAKLANAVMRLLPTIDTYEVIGGSQFYKLGLRQFKVESKSRRPKTRLAVAYLCRHCGGIYNEDVVMQHGLKESQYRKRRAAGLT